MKYMVVIEEGAESYSAHVPDLPGCIAVADSREEVLDLIHDAIKLHVEKLQRTGELVPLPRKQCCVAKKTQGDVR